MPPLVSFACSLPWNGMAGSDQTRHCTTCGHTVYNLSEISDEKRRDLLERAKTERICGAYFLRMSGERVTAARPLSLSEKAGVKQVGFATLSVAAMALASGCVSKPIPKMPQKEEPARQVQANEKVAQEEGAIMLLGFVVNAPATEPEKKK